MQYKRLQLGKRFFNLAICLMMFVLLVSGTNVAAAPIQSITHIVTNTSDSGFGSLRQAIANAMVGDTITFDNNLLGQTISLGSPLILSKDIIIDGSGLNPQIVISGNANNYGTSGMRVFYVNPGVSATLKFLTVTKGYHADAGGGIYNNGTLIVTNSVFSHNRSKNGGGIYNNGTLTVTNSTFSYNNAAEWSTGYGGGGIYNANILTATNTTFYNNSASSMEGGGIFNNGGIVNLKNNTISSNFGGGIYNSGILNMENTIVANSSYGPVDCTNSGTIGINLNNLTEDGSCSAAFNGDPMLTILADYGGSIPTMGLINGSPAINQGSDASCPEKDQRGITRPQRVHCDIGAVEVQPGEFMPFTQTWENVGFPGFSDAEAWNMSLAVSNGTPYIAYRDIYNSINGYGYATVMKFDGTNWVYVGSRGISVMNINSISIAIYNDTPYVAYSDASNRITVMKFDAGPQEWISIGSSNFAGDIDVDSLDVYNGIPYVVTGGYSASVMRLNPDTGDWVSVGSPGFSTGNIYHPSLFIHNGIPYIAYSDGDNYQKATVMKYDGTDWISIGVPGFSAEYAGKVSLVVYNDTPYVAYSDSSQGSKITVMKFDSVSGIWVNVGSPGFSAGDIVFPSLAFYNGAPYVAYQDFGNERKSVVMKFDGIKWASVGTPGFSPGFSSDTAGCTFLAIDNDGTSYVGFTDYSLEYKATVMKYVLTDITPPTVISVLRTNTNPTSAVSVDYTVTFSEPVTGVDVSDFYLPSSGVSGASVTNVSGSGTTYTVTVNTGSGSGTLQLGVGDNDTIIDAASNPLGSIGPNNGKFLGQKYTVDKTFPTVSSLVRASANPTSAATVQYTLTFSEPVTGVDASDFAVVPTGVAGSSVSSVSGAGTTYTVIVNAGLGGGTLGLNLTDNNSIKDAVGNELGGTGAGDGNYTGEVYDVNVVDATFPTVVSSLRTDVNFTNAAGVNFTVTFSEDVTGVDTADFSLATNVIGASIMNVSGSGTIYTVTANTGSGNGTLRLIMQDNDTVIDTAGNPLGGVGLNNGKYSVGQYYTIYKATPSVVSLVRASADPTNAATVQYTLTFSEPVKGVNAPDFIFTLTGDMTGASVVSVTGSGKTYTITINTGTGNGTLRLNVVDNDSITGLSGIPLGGAGDNGLYTGGEVYTINKP